MRQVTARVMLKSASHCDAEPLLIDAGKKMLSIHNFSTWLTIITPCVTYHHSALRQNSECHHTMHKSVTSNATTFFCID